MNDDLYLEILLHLSYIDIMNMCNTSSFHNKIRQSRYFWHQLIYRDFNYDMDDGWTIKGLKDFYHQSYKAVDKVVIKIISKLMKKRRLDHPLDMIYKNLFQLLGNLPNHDDDLIDEAIKNINILLIL